METLDSFKTVEEAVSEFGELRDIVAEATRPYVNNRPVIKYKCNECSSGIALKLWEVLLLGVITCNDCLLTGKTGTGKTRLAKLALNGLFGGDGFVNKTITPAMEPSDFLDINYGDVHSGKKSLKEALEAAKPLHVPALILNEPNRAPAMIQSYLIPLLDMEMDIEGKSFPVGKEVPGIGRQYQFRVLTINEGDAYLVTDMDKALRDRAVLTLALDAFYQGADDCHIMLEYMEQDPEATGFRAAETSYLERIIKLWSFLPKIKVSDEARRMLIYLSGMSYCAELEQDGIYPPLKELLDFTESYCRKRECRYAATTDLNPVGNLCGAVQAPSQRSLRHLLSSARGLVLARLAIEKDTPCQVMVEDLWAIAPLVLYRKLGLSYEWKNQSAGSEWIALNKALNAVRKRRESLPDKFRTKPLKELDQNELRKYAEEKIDCWVMRFADVQP